MAQDNRPDEGEKSKAKEGSFTESVLDVKKKKLFQEVKLRIPELQKGRQNHYGHNLDQLYADADRDYVPHRLGGTGKKRTAIVVDEDRGWRSSKITLGEENWQSDVSQSNPYVKIQTALSILVDQNPSGVFTPTNRKYQATTEIIKQLYQRSWEYAISKPQLKLFIFNLAKYGWATARTFPLRIVRDVQVLEEFNQEKPEDSVYTEKEVVEFNDIMRENLDPRNVWIDNMAKPNNKFSVKDWTWRKVYDFDEAEKEFGKYPLWKYARAGMGNTSETIGATANSNTNNSTDNQKNIDTKNLIEMYFYESRTKDLFMVLAGGAEGIPVVIEPLPVSDSKGLKRLSLWQTYWNIRHGESPYGIGVYEAIRFDQGMLDRIRNMTVDQLVLSIYKMFFYQGTQALTNTGDIKIAPGVGKQVLDPKNINWMEVPGPGKDAYIGIDMFRKDVDEASGLGDPLLGNVTGKTAFEIAQAKEAALKRMKNPLDNILEALNEEAYTTVSLIQLLYSIPETYKIADPRLIEDYLKETGSDPELFERTAQLDENKEPVIGMDGMPAQDFTAKVYPEFPLNLDKDDKGNLIETQDTRFFRTKPSALSWEGVINIKSQSILSPSKQVDKALELEMYNMLIPLLQGISQERMMLVQAGQPAGIDDLTNGKVSKSIIKLYDKDPRDLLPDSWMQEPEQQQAPSLFVNAESGGPGTGQVTPPGSIAPPGTQQSAQPQAPQAQTMIPSTQPPQNPTSLAGRVRSGISNLFS